MGTYAISLFRTYGGYLTLTGIWALIDVDSFMRVTGPKTDIWMVKTLSLMFTSMGLTFLLAAYLGEGKLLFSVLGFFTCASVLGIDVYYSLNEVIWKVYLIDGFMQMLFLAGFIMLLKQQSKQWKPAGR